MKVSTDPAARVSTPRASRRSPSLPAKRVPLFGFLTLFLMVCLSPSCGAGASPLSGYRLSDRYLGVVVGSYHFGDSSLSDFNPGLTFGAEWRKPGNRWQLFAEGGVFRNSYRETAPVLLAGIETDIGSIGPCRFRIGVATGTAYYRKLSASLERDYGIPNIGGFIPMAAASVMAQFGRNEIRLTTVPAAGSVKAIVNLSIVRSF